MTTIENVTIKFSDGKELSLTKEQFEELKKSFERSIWPTYPLPYSDWWTVRPWTIQYTTGATTLNTDIPGVINCIEFGNGRAGQTSTP